MHRAARHAEAPQIIRFAQDDTAGVIGGRRRFAQEDPCRFAKDVAVVNARYEAAGADCLAGAVMGAAGRRSLWVVLRMMRACAWTVDNCRSFAVLGMTPLRGFCGEFTRIYG